MKKSHLNLSYYPTLFYLLFTCVMAWIEIPYTSFDGLDVYRTIFACVTIFYGLYLVSKCFLYDDSETLGFWDVLAMAVPGLVVIYFGWDFLSTTNWTWVFLRDQLGTISMGAVIVCVYHYIYCKKFSLQGFATLLCILLFIACIAAGICQAIIQLDYIWMKLAYSLCVVGVWLKFIAELKDAED